MTQASMVQRVLGGFCGLIHQNLDSRKTCPEESMTASFNLGNRTLVLSGAEVKNNLLVLKFDKDGVPHELTMAPITWGRANESGAAKS